MADEPSNIEELADALKDFTAASGAGVRAIREVNNAVLETGKGVDGLAGGFKNAGLSLQLFTSGIANLTGAIPVVGGLRGAFDGLKDTMGLLQNAGSLMGETFMNGIRAADEMTAVNRELTSTNYALAAQFGQTLEEAGAFTDTMLESARVLAGEDLGFQNFATETQPMISSLTEMRVSFDRMSESVESSAGSFDLYSIAVLQAQSIGVSSVEYARLMSDLMIRQGLSAQEASQTLAVYKDIAQETGITVDVIADSLNGLGNNFRKMGLDASFGESFLRGFADSLVEVGVGIENAADLAQMFGARMASLGANYSSAFVTAQRGGLSMGSGGALGAGIQLQAKMLDQSIDQAQLGREIGEAVRDTIASFTGGDIVTVQEAAASKDPRKEAQYYMQTQLLGQMYGITDATEQARTLELLDKMSTAQATGDAEAQALLGRQLEDTLQMRTETMSQEEKMNATLTASLAELTLQSQLLGEFLMNAAGLEGAEAASMLDSTMHTVGMKLEKFGQGLDTSTDRESILANIRESLFGEGGELSKTLSRSNFTPGSNNLNQGGDIASILKGTLNVRDESLSKVLSELASILRTKLGMPEPMKTNGGHSTVPAIPGRDNSAL